ncbi:MAG TPA: M48 family metalloprotease, partial [Candidatus Xenobia bacterium]
SQVMRLEYAVDKHDDPALEEVARRLALASHLDAHVLAFHRATTDDVFSVSYPSGDTWLSDGLIRILESPDERAAVVAHEMAHVALGHFATWYADQDEPPVFMGLDRGDYLLRLNHHLLKEGWPAWMEDEADGQAILYMERAGYNPAAYAATLHKIQESRHAKTDWTHVHPLSAERWKNIQTWPERLGEVGDLSHAAAAFDPGLAASLEAHRVSLATALPATRAFVGLMQAAAAAGLPVRGEPVRLP